MHHHAMLHTHTFIAFVGQCGQEAGLTTDLA